MATMTYPEKNIVKAYSTLFENLSDGCKTALIEYLLTTMKKEQKKRDGFALSFGRWEGPSQSIDEIKAEITASRNFRKRDAIFI
jgi:hypothetical protein